MGNTQESTWLYGYRPVLEAVRAKDKAIKAIYIARGRKRGVEEISTKATKLGLTVHHVDERKLNALCGGGHHQGVAAQCEGFAYAEFERVLARFKREEKPTLVLALDGVQDPMNLGAILRTAAATGVALVIIPERKSASVTPVVLRASAGLARRVQVAQVKNMARSLGHLKDAGFWITGASAHEGSAPWAVDLAGRSVVVLGSEGKGIRRLVLESCDLLVKVPLAEGVESLNVSASAAMLLYEAVRQGVLVRQAQKNV